MADLTPNGPKPPSPKDTSGQGQASSQEELSEFFCVVACELLLPDKPPICWLKPQQFDAWIADILTDTDGIPSQRQKDEWVQGMMEVTLGYRQMQRYFQAHRQEFEAGARRTKFFFRRGTVEDEKAAVDATQGALRQMQASASQEEPVHPLVLYSRILADRLLDCHLHPDFQGFVASPSQSMDMVAWIALRGRFNPAEYQ